MFMNPLVGMTLHSWSIGLRFWADQLGKNAARVGGPTPPTEETIVQNLGIKMAPGSVLLLVIPPKS